MSLPGRSERRIHRSTKYGGCLMSLPGRLFSKRHTLVAKGEYTAMRSMEVA